MEITTLVENSQGEHTGLVVEHGLSFLIESETTSILFDTGQSDAFIRNAQKLQKDLSRVEHVVLSHGHYDHSGGFRSFVGHAGAGSFKLWTGEGFFTPKYGKFNSSYQYLGNDFGGLRTRGFFITAKQLTPKSCHLKLQIVVLTNLFV